MDNCVDHPSEEAIYSCQVCSRMICGKHKDMMCERDYYHAKRSAIPVLIFTVFSIALLSTTVYFFIFQLGETLTRLGGLENGDVVTVNKETVTVTNAPALPNFGTIVFVVFLFIAPILISIIWFLRRQITHYRASPEYQENFSTPRQDRKTFYCQQCGALNDITEMTCVKCGKSTDEERKLVK